MRSLLLLCILLTACGTAVVLPSDTKGTHTIRFEFGPLGGPHVLYEKAHELCPGGWEKLRERQLREGPWGHTYAWDIRCL